MTRPKVVRGHRGQPSLVAPLSEASASSIVVERHRHWGVVAIAMAAVFWSTSGFFVRLITVDLMTLLFWRGIFSGTALFMVFFLLKEPRRTSEIHKLSWSTIGVMVASALAMICGISALRFTTVAEVMVIYATTPFVTAAVAWLLIGERPSRSTILASLVALCGVGVMLIDAQWGNSMIGRVLALGPPFMMALMTTILRRSPNAAMLPAVAGSAWLCSAFSLPFAMPLTISPLYLGLCAVFGVVQNAAGLAFYTLGSRRVPAAEATLIASLEVPLTPFWVWLAFGETASPSTLIGGAMVLSALVGHILIGKGRFATPTVLR
jgi:drug/metabolite transporter (DMT)-like permease